MAYLRIKSCRLLLLAVSFLAASSLANAQVKVTESTKSGEPNEIIEMSVSAAPQADPIFKHRLTSMPNETIAGNAATAYMHLFASGFLDRCVRFEKQYDDELQAWSQCDTPRDQIPLQKLREASALFDVDFKHYIDRASRSRHCDWGYQIEDLTGPMAIGVTLDTLQDTRAISRIIALQTKLAILDSRFEDATNLMRMNYRLAENVGEVKLVVGSLIALTVTGISNDSMLALIAAPDAPNMYWALTELPCSIANVRAALRMEVGIGLRIFPEIANAESTIHTREEWSRIVRGMPRTAMEISYAQPPAKRQVDFMALGAGLLSYAPAKRRLIDSGMDANQVEQMAVGQVLLIDANREYRRLANRFETAIYFPLEGAIDRARTVEDQLFRAQEEERDSVGTILASMLLPALQHVRYAELRVQRDIDALRVIEALRMHAAKEGKFPGSLDEVKVVPVPNNPTTGKPFEYRLEGEVATIELPKAMA